MRELFACTREGMLIIADILFNSFRPSKVFFFFLYILAIFLVSSSAISSGI